MSADLLPSMRLSIADALDVLGCGHPAALRAAEYLERGDAADPDDEWAADLENDNDRLCQALTDIRDAVKSSRGKRGTTLAAARREIDDVIAGVGDLL